MYQVLFLAQKTWDFYFAEQSKQTHTNPYLRVHLKSTEKKIPSTFSRDAIEVVVYAKGLSAFYNIKQKLKRLLRGISI